MGFTDDLDVLFTEEVYEVQLAESNLTVKEAGSPFALIENVFAGANQQGIAADAYRQVTYLNDTTYENTQVLMEYAVNGNLGSTTTAYSFGVQRESFVETTAGMGAGATIGGMTYHSSGTYYYTGTGSVANVTGSATNQSYTYTAGGIMTAFAMSASAENETSTLTTNPTAYGTYGVYSYNGEYTHTNLGLQYLRARYLNVATGTFTSKDTYVGRLQDILSQNRYTYAENNPVGHSDPSGHAVTHGNKAARGFNQQTTMSTAERARQATQNSVKNYAQTQRLNNMTTTERAVSATQNSINSYIKEKRQSLQPNISIPNVGVGRNDIAALQWPESISAKIEKAMCAAYDRCTNAVQEELKAHNAYNRLDRDCMGDSGTILVKSGGTVFYIQNGVTRVETNTETGLIEIESNYVQDNWGMAGKGKYPDGIQKDENGYYKIAVGPRILNPNYPDNGRIWETDFNDNQRVDIIIEDKATNDLKTIQCVVVDVKANTYNQYPDGHENDTLPYIAYVDVDNGVIQTGIAYPNSSNAGYDENGNSEAYARNNFDVSIIEFAGHELDFVPSNYVLKEVTVLE